MIPISEEVRQAFFVVITMMLMLAIVVLTLLDPSARATMIDMANHLFDGCDGIPMCF